MIKYFLLLPLIYSLDIFALSELETLACQFPTKFDTTITGNKTIDGEISFKIKVGCPFLSKYVSTDTKAVLDLEQFYKCYTQLDGFFAESDGNKLEDTECIKTAFGVVVNFILAMLLVCAGSCVLVYIILYHYLTKVLCKYFLLNCYQHVKGDFKDNV